MDIFSRLKEKKILLIDDDEWVRNSLSLFFEDEGCNLMPFETAEEGMEALKKQSYDIIISDYRLPGMDGLEFFKRIQEFHPHAMKILISGYGNEGVFSEARKIGIDAFIEKPLTGKAIEECLSCLVEEGEQVN